MAERNSSPIPVAPRTVYWFKCTDSDSPIEVPQSTLEELEKHSDVFVGGREIASGSEEGKSAQNPIIIPDGSYDFQGLIKSLQLFYVVAPAPGAEHRLTKDEWLGVLRLTQKYQMDQVMNTAIEALSNDESFGPIERVQRGREFHFAPWLLLGIEGLLDRCTTSILSDLGGLDAATAEKVIWVKNAIRDPESIPRSEMGRLLVSLIGTLATFRYSEMSCQGVGCSQQAFYPAGGECMECGTVFSSTDTFTTTNWFQPLHRKCYQVKMSAIICTNTLCGKKCISLKRPKKECGYVMGIDQDTYYCDREPTSTHDFILLAFTREEWTGLGK